jgi:E3 ubiquitin-protein ligase CHFR
VLVLPCQHFFCGSCLTLWFHNGGTTCPQCRQAATNAIPFRAIQSLIDLLLHLCPGKGRTQRDMQQADAIYRQGTDIKVPLPPKPAAPETLSHRSELNESSSHHLARPCPHCSPNNPFGWECPQPIVDPAIDPGNAWNLDEGLPPGHGWCATCDALHALSCPSSSQCSLCSGTFCGLSVPHLCIAPPVSSGHLPPRISTLSGLIQSADIYGVFGGNTVEVEIFFDWLRSTGRSARTIYIDVRQPY